VAFYLPWLEIIDGFALLTGLLHRGALTILTTLMVFFIAATISAQARGINLDCGCFGSVSKGMSFTTHMLIDLALLGGLVALWILPARQVR
jgi:putative oxidoreductase